MPAKVLFWRGEEAHGAGNVVVAWDPMGSALATCGTSLRVHVWTRSGDELDQFQLVFAGACLQMAWDLEGEQLAILQEGDSNITIWNRRTKTRSDLATNLKEPTLILWSRVGPQLAIGTAQGNLLMYNSRTKRKVPIVGKHARKVSCGAWNLQNKLALCSTDRVVTVSDAEGATLFENTMKALPISMKFAEKKVDEKKTDRDHTLSMNMDRRTVFMYDLDDPHNPIELAFQPKYGDIIDYVWYGDGYILAAFSGGFVVVISTHMKEIGEELHCLKLHEESMNAVSVTIAGNMFATCADDGVRVVDLSDWRELKLATVDREQLKGTPRTLEWTCDGQILTVSTTTGLVSNFLISIPSMGASYKNSAVFLSSLREVTHMKDFSENDKNNRTISLEVEPSFMAIGETHIAVGMNNRAWFYSIDNHKLERECDFVGSVKQITLNGTHCAVLTTNGQVQIHPIVQSNADEGSQVFPDRGENNITCMGLTDTFLIYANSSGSVYHLLIDSTAADGTPTYKLIDEFRHGRGVRAIYPSVTGTRSVIIDESGLGFVFSPVDHQLIEVHNFSPTTKEVIWDNLGNSTCFVTVGTREERIAMTYVYTAQTLRGPVVQFIDKTSLLPAFFPVAVENGYIFGTRASDPSKLSSIILSSHEHVTARTRMSPERLVATCMQFIQLGRLQEAWQMAIDNGVGHVWNAIGEQALQHMDVSLAFSAFQMEGSTSRVMALDRILTIEDSHLLAGHILMLQGLHDEAEKMLLMSSQPKIALDMRRDLLHWDRALRLTQSLDPALMPEICRENAAQLELKGSFEGALSLYRKAIEGLEQLPGAAGGESWARCQKGLARIAIHTGDVPTGKQIIGKLADQSLMRECAGILENSKQFNDAAEMYVQCQAFEKAAGIYIHTKNYRQAGPLMKYITTPKLHAQYAKAKEKEGDFAEAERAYEIAEDVNSVVRLNLEHLEPAKAFAIVRKTRSAEGASLIAQFCRANHDFDSAIEFLMLAQRCSEAFQLAETHDRMDQFSEVLGAASTTEQFENIATYYENRKEFAKAGQCRLRLGQYQRALRLFLMSGNEAIDLAIDVVRDAKDRNVREELIGLLQRFLSGESDGKAKDPKHLFKLFIATEDYDRAAQIATLIASDEQKAGNYKNAHDILLSVHRELRKVGSPLPEELKRSLVLLHSYSLVKQLAGSGDHHGAARMLIRVAKNVSKFGQHVVPILTSTVIECTKAGLKRSSYEYASMLMRPEYRQLLNPKYKRQIETIVRRRVQEEDEEPNSPCPFCANPIPETLLDCVFCKNTIPFCSVTGKHMALADWSECPHCKFPALFAPFTAHIAALAACPMCEGVIAGGTLYRVDNPLQDAPRS